MTQYIDKDALVTWIKNRLLPTINSHADDFERGEDNERLQTFNFINTLEVKELDLEKYINDLIPSKYCWSSDGKAVYTKEQMVEFAKHYFEIGIRLQKKRNQFHRMI